MKKIFSIALIAATLIACNENKSTDSTVTTDTALTTTMPDPAMDNMATAPAYTPANGDVMMKDGKMMMMIDGSMMVMDHNMTLGNGTMVMQNGDVKMTNGKMTKLTDGTMVDAKGTMYDKDGIIMNENMMMDKMNDTSRM